MELAIETSNYFPATFAICLFHLMLPDRYGSQWYGKHAHWFKVKDVDGSVAYPQHAVVFTVWYYIPFLPGEVIFSSFLSQILLP